MWIQISYHFPKGNVEAIALYACLFDLGSGRIIVIIVLFSGGNNSLVS